MSFSFSISPSSECSRLISFRIDCFDLLAVQGTLKSLPQHLTVQKHQPLHRAFLSFYQSENYTSHERSQASTSRSSLSSHSALYTHFRPLATSFPFGGSRRQDGRANFQKEEGEIPGPGCREVAFHGSGASLGAIPRPIALRYTRGSGRTVSLSRGLRMAVD